MIKWLYRTPKIFFRAIVDSANEVIVACKFDSNRVLFTYIIYKWCITLLLFSRAALIWCSWVQNIVYAEISLLDTMAIFFSHFLQITHSKLFECWPGRRRCQCETSSDATKKHSNILYMQMIYILLLPSAPHCLPPDFGELRVARSETTATGKQKNFTLLYDLTFCIYTSSSSTQRLDTHGPDCESVSRPSMTTFEAKQNLEWQSKKILQPNDRDLPRVNYLFADLRVYATVMVIRSYLLADDGAAANLSD